jgi:hypothetical protein
MEMADKTTAKQSPAKKAAKKLMSKGEAYLCEIYGLSVNVDACGEFRESQGLICCGKPMKEKSSSKTAK